MSSGISVLIMLLGLVPYTLGVVPCHCVLMHLCFDHGAGTGAYTLREVPSQCVLRHLCFDHCAGTGAYTLGEVHS